MKFSLTRLLLTLLLFGSFLAPLQAQEADEEEVDLEAAYSEALESIEADLAAQLEELTTVRNRIAQERPPLAKQANEIALEVREKRNKSRLALQERDALVHDLNELSNRVRLWRDEQTYVTGLLEEHRKQFESGISLTALNTLEAGADTPNPETPEARLKHAEQSIELLASAIGGSSLSGKALNTDGVALDGQFVNMGPVTWFVAEDKSIAGIVQERKDLQSEVIAMSGEKGAIGKLAEGQPATLTMDPTLGAALALEETNSSLIAHIQDGGFWIYPILFLALVATLAAILKWVQILRIRELRPDVVREVLDALHKGDRAAAEARVAKLNHPSRQLLLRGIEVSDQPSDYVEEALYEKYVEAQPKLQKGLIFIAIASATAPLLGLLGTVTGMIHTFELINIFGTGDAKSLASGISEALVTTEFGLVVAIPALILHALLSRRVQGILSSMEMTSLAFINGLNGKPQTVA